MKRLIISSLSIICLALAVTTSVKAESKIEHLMKLETTISNNTTSTEITPFELVARGYQGAYRLQGIPGFGSFRTAYATKMITAKDLVKAAIEANQLAPETQTNRDYLNAVDLQLSGGHH
ncbi:hypothetical protein [Chamaesiphon sp.]|uniref:hypothetical protein n=1 Tax=Chamaesiphon sp. TaxID=2814140 RepID=UPI003593105A